MASKAVQDLKAWVLSHYNEGGDWIYETYSDADYEKALQSGFKAAKVKLQKEWNLAEHVSQALDY